MGADGAKGLGFWEAGGRAAQKGASELSRPTL